MAIFLYNLHSTIAETEINTVEITIKKFGSILLLTIFSVLKFEPAPNRENEIKIKIYCTVSIFLYNSFEAGYIQQKCVLPKKIIGDIKFAEPQKRSHSLTVQLLRYVLHPDGRIHSAVYNLTSVSMS